MKSVPRSDESHSANGDRFCKLPCCPRLGALNPKPATQSLPFFSLSLCRWRGWASSLKDTAERPDGHQRAWLVCP